MTEQIVRLSHHHSGTQTSNSEWISTIPNAITLKRGDSISIHSIFLDVALSNNQTSLVEKDCNITLNFCPFVILGEEMNTFDSRYCYPEKGQPGLENEIPSNVPLYTVFCPENDPTTWEVLEQSFKFTVKDGLYTPQSLAMSMTDGLTKGDLTQIGNPPIYELINFPLSNNGFCKFINQYGEQTLPTPYSPGRVPYYHWTMVGKSITEWNSTVLNAPSRFVYVPDLNGEFKANVQVLGSSEVGIEYVDGVFKFFNFLPYHLPADKPSVWSAIYSLLQGGDTSGEPAVWGVRSTYGGVFFTGYEDDYDTKTGNTFFQSVLGIDPKGFCIDKATLAAGGYSDTYNNYITKLKTSLDLAFINKYNYNYTPNNKFGGVPVAEDLANAGFKMIQSNITEIDYPPAFVGEAVSDTQKGGHYLVEISNITSTQMVGDQLGQTPITAILSKQYNYNTTITGFQDSGVNYVHNGESEINLQSFQVSIKNPNNGKPVSNLNIGDKSYIYLSIIQNLDQSPSQQEQEQAQQQQHPKRRLLRKSLR